MEIFIVRHGETEWSATGRHTSRTDLPLTDRGRERAVALRSEIGRRSFALVLTSPLRRARETCELAGFGHAAELCDDLREWDYGDYEGLTTPQIRAENPNWVLWRDGCPGGETPQQVGERAARALERLRQADSDSIGFAHGHILRVLTTLWLEMAVAAGARFALDAGGVGVLGFERDTHALRRWNA